MTQSHEHESHGNTLAAAAAGTGAGAISFVGASHALAEKGDVVMRGVSNAAESPGIVDGAARTLGNRAGQVKDFVIDKAGNIKDIAVDGGIKFSKMGRGKQALVIAAAIAATVVAAKVTQEVTKPHNSLGNPPDAELSGRVAGQEQVKTR